MFLKKREKQDRLLGCPLLGAPHPTAPHLAWPPQLEIRLHHGPHPSPEV